MGFRKNSPPQKTVLTRGTSNSDSPQSSETHCSSTSENPVDNDCPNSSNQMDHIEKKSEVAFVSQQINNNGIDYQLFFTF